MAKNATTKRENEPREGELLAKINELNGRIKQLTSERDDARASADAYKRASETAKAKAQTAVDEAKRAKADALEGMGPSVLVELVTDCRAPTGDPLVKGRTVGVLHLDNGLSPDWLASVINTGKVKIVRGIAEGVFVGQDLANLYEANAQLSAKVAELEGDQKGSKAPDTPK